MVSVPDHPQLRRYMNPSKSRTLLPIDLAPPSDGRPLTPAELHEARAVHLALALAVGLLHAEAFTAAVPLGAVDCYSRCAWLRSALQPLAAHAPTVRLVRRALEPDCFAQPWLSATQMRRQLTALRRRARPLAAHMAAARRRSRP